ncbi:MAG: DUF2283 domain-containing protein [Candidatus Methylomirabilales bacterium]
MSEGELLEQVHVSYDPQQDVLSIYLGEPSQSPDSEVQGQGVKVGLREGKIVLVYILNAHRRIHDALKGQP